MKSTTPYNDPDRIFNKQMLKEAGEMKLNWLMDIFMGPDPNTSYESAIEARRDALGRYLTVVSSFYAGQFKPGDNILIYDPEFPLDHIRAFRTVVDYVDDDKIYTKTAVNIPGGGLLSIAPELVFRVAAQNCYREDEYGVTRFYSARGGPSEFSDSLGDMFDYEFKFPEYTLTLQNYKDQKGTGFFDPYLPGGDMPVNWGGRLVKIYLSAGEEAVKNKLKWEGITHFNAGVSQENDVLTLNCYHISYIYNQPVGRFKFPSDILDSEKANTTIPPLFGDYTVGFQKLNGRTYPTVPATLMYSGNTPKTAVTALYYSDAGRDKTTVFKSKFTDATTVKTGNNTKIVLEFYDYTQPFYVGTAPSSWITVSGKSVSISSSGGTATAISTAHGLQVGDRVYISGTTNFNGLRAVTSVPDANTFTFGGIPFNYSTQVGSMGPYTITIKLYKGVGLPTGSPLVYSFNSTAFVKYLIENNALANALIEVTGTTNVPIRDYSQMRFEKNQSYYETKLMDKIELITLGGLNEKWAEYQICGNPLDSDTTNYKIWYCKGNPDEPNNWENSNSSINGVGVTPYWQTNTGKVIVRGLPDVELEDYKLFVAVKGREQKVTRDVNTDCYINIAHNKHFATQNVSQKSKTNKIDQYQLPLDIIKPVAGFNQGYGYNGQGMQIKANGKGQRYYINQYYYHYTEETEFAFDKPFWMDIEFQLNQAINEKPYAIFSAGNSSNLNKMELLIEDYKLTLNFGDGKKIITDFEPDQDVPYLIELNYKPSNGVIDILVWEPNKSSRYSLDYIQRDEFEDGDEFLASIWQFSHAYPMENVAIGSIPMAPGISALSYDNKDLKCFIGVVRVVNNRYLYNDPDVSTTIVGDANYDEQFVDYNSATYPDDPVTIAKSLLLRSGVPYNRFDETWEQYARDRRVYAYNARLYISENGTKTLDAACALLGEIGFILKMRPVGGELKFTLINDNLDGYQANLFNDVITDYDIEEGSFTEDRETNQYFNICYAKFNYLPSMDDLGEESKAYKEVNAFKKDLGLNHWFRLDKEDDHKPCFEFPSLYQYNDVEERLKNTLRIATPNPEMITCTLTWKHILLEVGQFVRMTYGRYKNAPMMVREVTIDETASRITVKLMNLEQIKFYDEITGELHTPTGGTLSWIPVGGVDAVIEAIEDTQF